MNKIKAASIHLAISLFVLSGLLLYAFYIWYPAPYSSVAGFEKIISMLIFVDLILGPFLTFIIYKENKPHLALDISAIAVIQLIALVYGIHTIYKAHPAYIVFAVDRFELIPTMDVTPSTAKLEDLQVSTLWKPKLAFASIPKEPEAHKQLLFEVLFQGKPGVERRPQYYEPIEDHRLDILARALNIEALLDTKEKKNQLVEFLKKHGGNAKAYAFYPLVGNTGDLIIGIRREDGKVIDTLSIDPWKQ